MTLDGDERSARRLAAKRTNERVKLIATLLNALTIGVLGAGVIVPGVAEPTALLQPSRVVWFLVAIVLHLAGHAAFAALKSED